MRSIALDCLESLFKEAGFSLYDNSKNDIS